ncbi:MAG: NusG domain II-containing protein [Lachnospiraceae bacterium]|nr:NusG domain II-containing protein [Lachnospiraceae bacterium]
MFLKKALPDLAVILILFGTAFLLYLWRGFPGGGSAADPEATVIVESGGGLYGTYSIRDEETIIVDSAYGHNTIRIEDGAVFVTDADCRDHVCMRSGKIRRRGESIICLPNRLTVRITGKGEDGYDAVAY